MNAAASVRIAPIPRTHLIVPREGPHGKFCSELSNEAVTDPSFAAPANTLEAPKSCIKGLSTACEPHPIVEIAAATRWDALSADNPSIRHRKHLVPRREALEASRVAYDGDDSPWRVLPPSACEPRQACCGEPGRRIGTLLPTRTPRRRAAR